MYSYHISRLLTNFAKHKSKGSMIIGIGGVSRSGKSFLADELRKLFEKTEKSVRVLPQDIFVYPESEIPLIHDHIDWECPESIDFEKFIRDIKKSESENDITIVEGLMVFWNHDLLDLFTIRIFIGLDKNEFIRRKDKDLRWGKEPQWYVEYIWDSYLKYGQLPGQIKADISLNGNNRFDPAVVFSKIAYFRGLKE